MRETLQHWIAMASALAQVHIAPEGFLIPPVLYRYPPLCTSCIQHKGWANMTLHRQSSMLLLQSNIIVPDGRHNCGQLLFNQANLLLQFHTTRPCLELDGLCVRDVVQLCHGMQCCHFCSAVPKSHQVRNGLRVLLHLTEGLNLPLCWIIWKNVPQTSLVR